MSRTKKKIFGMVGICRLSDLDANLIEELLPEQYTEIHIDKDLSKGFDYRLITVEEVQR